MDDNEFAGWVVWLDGRELLWDSIGPQLFDDIEEARAARDALGVVCPVSRRRVEELCRQFRREPEPTQGRLF